jgi:AraC-like DNA-binding protein
VAGDREWVRAWRPAVAGVAEVFHARFVEHAYPPHTHDTWTVFVVDEGAIRYDLERRERGAARSSRVTILPPHVVHDGRPGVAAGYRKRVLYLDLDVLGERAVGPSIDRPDVHDRELAADVRSLHRSLLDPADAFEAESRLALVGERLRDHLGETHEHEGIRGIAESCRDLLDANVEEPPTLAELGRLVHASPAHVVRTFTRAFGTPPHRYLVGRRIDAARRRLLEGERPADVASAVGFTDQAHLTRLFRRYVGTTPARFARSVAS